MHTSLFGEKLLLVPLDEHKQPSTFYLNVLSTSTLHRCSGDCGSRKTTLSKIRAREVIV